MIFTGVCNFAVLALLLTESLANDTFTNSENNHTLHTEIDLHPEGFSGKKPSYPYTEKLDIKVLPRNHLLTSFNFNIVSEPVNVSSSSDSSHYKVFPRSLAPILESTNTRELHLRFGQGWWDSEEWGQLPNSGANAGGVGVEIWAVIEAKNKSDSFDKWSTLTSSLSGLFCASLNYIDSSNTIFPIRSFKSNDRVPILDEENDIFLLRAALASEPVCTENLTPFVKFLPTRGKTGLSSLLDGHRVFESQWHMMSIDIDTECQDGSCKYNMNQRIEAVVNIDKSLRKKFNPIPKPLPGSDLLCDLSKPYDSFQCFPLGFPENLSFTLKDLLGRDIQGANLISNERGRICVNATDDWDILVKVNESYYGTDSNCFELKEDAKFDVLFKTEKSSSVPEISKVPVYASRSLTGYGQDKGQSRINFKNPTNETVKILYLESLPWFMRVYLHSITVNGAEKDQIIQNIYYLPEVDRQKPTHIEFELILPPNSNIALSYLFDKSLLLYSEYPPDANHGFSVEPGVINVLEPFQYSFRTSPALLTLPTPDFSMPYNVIILSSTVMALAFGTIFNLLSKRLVTEEEAELVLSETGLKARLEKIKHKLINRLNLLKNKIIPPPKEIEKEIVH